MDRQDLGGMVAHIYLLYGTFETKLGAKMENKRSLNRFVVTAVALLLLTVALSPFPAAAVEPPVFINEIRIDQPSADNDEYFELAGAAGTTLNGLTYLVIGDGSGGSGVIENVTNLAGQSISASGFFVAAESTFSLGTADFTTSLNFENSDNVTHLLVENFTGSSGDDLDTDDDGVLDSTPWTSVVDSVALIETVGSGDQVYSSTTVGPDGSFVPGHAFLCPTDWQIGAFNPDGGDDTPGATNSCPPVDPVGVCNDPATLIHDIQEGGALFPDAGSIREIEGIVTGDFQDDVGTNGDLNGFFMQEEDSQSDGDALTSEGIFVFQGSNPVVDVAIGDLVRVRGTVAEFSDLTEITNVNTILICGTETPLEATEVTLPVDSIDDLEAYEGMLITFPQTLYISEFFNFDRFGEIVLTTDRQFQPTATFEPGSPDAAALADLNARSRITLDDGRTNSNPDPAIHPNGMEFTLDNRFRGGDTVQDVTGVLNYGFGLYRIQPTQGADYTPANPRPETPDDVGGDVTVASFNVLNYYTTIDQSGAQCFPSMTRSDCRGADNVDEFQRQRAKIIIALAEIDADVVGLIEIENNVNDDAVIDLVAGLNDAVGAGTYDYVPAGTTGTDTIKVAFIYKPAAVTTIGSYAVLDDASFVDPLDTGEDRNRPALAQTFMDNSTGGIFTLIVNHFKSKSGSELDDTFPVVGICVDADPINDIDDCDQGDGQAYFNATRTATAQALVNWLATDPTGSGDPDFLIIGDLNSYDKEDPIDVLTDNGYTDLLAHFGGESAYSYVFDGQLGYLDYGMANSDLFSQVTGVTAWHINADEPDILDYDTTFKQDAQDALYEPNAFRSSDHDPVIVGLQLDTPRVLKERAATGLAALLPTGDKNTDKRISESIARIDESLNLAWWNGDLEINSKKVFDRERQAVVQLELIVASGVPEAGDAQFAINLLIEADRRLAQQAIDFAIAGGGNPGKIAEAQAEMALAAADVAAGLFNEAVNHYKTAWMSAINAL